MPNITTRKGLPVPLVTDAAGTNYTVGPAGRTITTTGKVRDEIGAISTLLDGIVEYNQDEQISGRFEFQSPFITDKGIGQLFQNNTGAQRVLGDVVIIDPSNDSAIILPTSAGVSAGKIGVVVETINAAAVGRVAFNGFARVKVASGVTRNQYLTTQNASVVAAGGAYQTSGSFAISVTNQDLNNMVLALLHGGSSLEGGGQINGNVGIGGAVLSNVSLAIESAVSAASGQAHGIEVIPTLTAVANNDVLYGINCSPTFADAGHTGVIHYGIYSGTGWNAFIGNTAIGGGAIANAVLSVVGTGSSGATQYGLQVATTLNNATSSAQGLGVVTNTANGFTAPFLAGIRVQGITLGTSQSITNMYGYYSDPLTAAAGITNVYGMWISDVSGASGENVALVVQGLTRFKTYTCKVYNSTNASLVTNTAVPFDSESYKTVASMHSTSSNNTRMIAPVTGKYRITANLQFGASNVGTFRGVEIVQNSSTILATSQHAAVLDNVNTTGITCTVESTLNANDWIEIYALNNTGGSVTVLANLSWSPVAEMTLVSL